MSLSRYASYSKCYQGGHWRDRGTHAPKRRACRDRQKLCCQERKGIAYRLLRRVHWRRHPHHNDPTQGVDNERIHKLAWDAFTEGTKLAKEQGLYGAGQDLLKDSFSGNVKGMGPGVAEIEMEERPSEVFCIFAA